MGGVKMKKISELIITFLVFFFVSCDPNECATLYIKNSTNSVLEVNFYKQNEIIKNVYIDENTQEELFSKSCATGSPLLPNLNTYDSIVVSINDIHKIVYKENKSGKNIYNYEYWIIDEKGKRDYEYTFEITNQDLNIK